MHLRTRLGLALLALFAVATTQPRSANGSGFSLEGIIKAGVEFDSNPERLNGDTTEADLVERLFLELGVDSSGPGQLISGTLRFGAKRFEEARDEDALVVDLAGNLQRQLWPATGLFVSLNGRDRTERGHIRDYTRADGQAGLFVSVGDVYLRAGPGLRYFLYKPDDTLSTRSLGGIFSFSWTPGEIVGIGLSYRYQVKTYAQDQLDQGDAGLFVVEGESRQDDDHTVGVTLDLKSSFLARLEFYFQQNLSNSFGKAFSRIIVRLGTTVSLPWEIYLTGRTSIQRTSFSEGVLIDPTFTVDDENRNTLELSLSRDIVDWLRVELRYSLYLQEFGGDDSSYERHLVFGGLASPFQL